MKSCVISLLKEEKMSLFEQTIDRHNTQSVKWDSIKENYQEKDLLPMWIADMDFSVLPTVRSAFQEYIEQGIFGYNLTPDSLYQDIIDWQKRRHQFTISKEEILFNSGVIQSLALAVQAYSKKGDAIMIHDRIYPPSAQVIKDNERKLIYQPLLEEQNFSLDFTAMEKSIIAHQVKLFILCNPHNPGGRLWSKAELKQMGEICQKHGVLVVSD